VVAKKVETEIAFTPEEMESGAHLTPDIIPEDWEFETVVRESPTKVILDKIGDRFLGMYEGVETIVPESTHVDTKTGETVLDDPFNLHVFMARDGIRYAVNSGYKIDRALTDDYIGRWVMLTYVQDIDSKKGNPMKDLRVDVKR
jgi:hypothetical protein